MKKIRKQWFISFGIGMVLGFLIKELKIIESIILIIVWLFTMSKETDLLKINFWKKAHLKLQDQHIRLQKKFYKHLQDEKN